MADSVTQDTRLTPGAIYEWLNVVDPDETANTVYHFNKTFLMSGYSCIYGRGCKGIGLPGTPDHQHGCCSMGVYFRDEDDLNNTMRHAMDLGPDDWDMYHEAARNGTIVDRRNGKSNYTEYEEFPVKTRMVDGACIFSNRGKNGKTGCALHHKALKDGADWTQVKPYTCVTVPLSLDETEEEDGVLHITLDLRTIVDWQAEDDFRYWCGDDPAAYTASGGTPAYINMRQELVYLLGQRVYDLLVAALESQVGFAMPPEHHFLPIVEVT